MKNIAIFTERKWGREQRNHYLLELDNAFKKLADNPLIGKKCDFIHNGYRKFPAMSHMIYYRNDVAEHIDIVRVMHKRMDATAILFVFD